MAKASKQNNNKVSFGKRKTGPESGTKSFNKHHKALIIFVSKFDLRSHHYH